ncbi:MAG TPA: adenylate/guanylate cyclase domain-containing protein, partial [Thermoleophilaceae bacterium]|nr:adenylate/guanylate cyclase domain-containing protein [Thermoleophilaceae bacterium]
MTSNRRRRGIFEGLPRAGYRLTGARYFDAAAAGAVLNGVVVAGFSVLTLVLYVDVHAGEVVPFAACLAAVYVVEGLAAGAYLRRAAEPARRWLAGERDDRTTVRAWSATASLPLTMFRRPALWAIGAVGLGAADLLLAERLDLPAHEAALLFPASYLLYVSSVILRYTALELGMRPVLEDVGRSLPATSPSGPARVSLHGRLVVTVPMVTWGASILVTGLLTENRRDFDTIALAGIVAFGVTAAISIWLSLVLADAVSAPLVDLRDATRRVGGGDLSVRVPVVSTDETGELAASFNAMVAGLGERERLREAFGAFVDPALTERVLAEGADLQGELVEVSLVFLDVRGFTAIAERYEASEVVARLNALYEAVVPVILGHGGHANKFIGDGLLAVFGAPDRKPDHADRAVAAALDIAALVRERYGD